MTEEQYRAFTAEKESVAATGQVPGASCRTRPGGMSVQVSGIHNVFIVTAFRPDT